MTKKIGFNTLNYKMNVVHDFGYKHNWIPKSIQMGISCRFYPTSKQEQVLAQQFGNVRFVWNKFWAWLKKQYQIRNKYYKKHHIDFSKMSAKKRKQIYKNLPKILQKPSETDLDKVLKQGKKTYTWLKTSDSRSLQLEIKNLLNTISNASAGKCRQPKFKSRKSHRQAYTTDTQSLRSKHFVQSSDRIKMPKLKSCKVHLSRKIIGLVKQATVILKPNSKYYISLSVVCDSQALPLTNRCVGIDMNLSYLAVLSTGQKYNLKHYYKVAYPELKSWQKKSARRRRHATKCIRQANHYLKEHPNAYVKNEYYMFHNYVKARQKVASIFHHVHNQAENYLQRITTSIVKRFDVICMENLKVSQMVHNHNLARSIEHGYWREFRRLIEYKCAWYGKTFIPVNKNNTTRCCWYCHKSNGKIGLGVEEWKCSNPNCPFHSKYHDRDINAAINILMLGLHWVRPQTLQPLYDYTQYEFNSDLISGFSRVDYISTRRRGIHRKDYAYQLGISVR